MWMYDVIREKDVFVIRCEGFMDVLVWNDEVQGWTFYNLKYLRPPKEHH